MESINILKNVVVDKGKVSEMVGKLTMPELCEILGVKESQAYYVRRGERLPTVHGLVRLMLYHNMKPDDLVALRK